MVEETKTLNGSTKMELKEKSRKLVANAHAML